MAYASMENAIILKGTRHGLLASVREDADWKEVLRELSSLATQNSEFLKDAQLVLDFGWRETSEDQFDSIVAVLQAQGLGCNGILSTSLNTRTIAESRGYRAIIGRLGLAQHQGRRLRRDQQEAAMPASDPSLRNVATHTPDASAPAPLSAAAMNAAAKGLSDPTIASGLVIQPVAPADSTLVKPSAVKPTTVAPIALDSVEGPIPIAANAPAQRAVEDSMDTDQVSLESSLEVAPASTFDSADPVVANLPMAFDSSELEGPRAFSSSHEPGIHVPHYQDEEPTLYIRKTLRSGQRVVFAGNVVLLGDLNPGAQIEADGDVIVLGQLRGSVHAGCEGDEEATVVTSSLRATQLRIADRFYKADPGSRFFRKTPLTGTLRARLDGDTVVVEALPGR
jgi:septum site-determining protein MinC